MAKAVDLRVTGLVQGVFFRAEAQQEAYRLGVSGWVRNEPDGSVAAHVEGDSGAVDAMVAWCREGPRRARVAGVDVRDAEVTGARSFDVD
ncbi:acylphosphatase [Nocardioides sp.]|uniref:acylphosphatase n=1 Tax=Nocardioides sp. TaxID=35761 RepID=UPI002D7E4FFE|nr:acylphosphatase [Nocardioides sp.]HET8959198.1 acylphosphatase [Nocardioides sp.]